MPILDSEYDLHEFAGRTAKASRWIAEKIDAKAVQTIATRAFKASERMLIGKAKKVRFKGKENVSAAGVVSNNSASLEEFCAELDRKEREIRKLQRQNSRQLRANNPDNYEPDFPARNRKCQYQGLAQAVFSEFMEIFV